MQLGSHSHKSLKQQRRVRPSSCWTSRHWNEGRGMCRPASWKSGKFEVSVSRSGGGIAESANSRSGGNYSVEPFVCVATVSHASPVGF